ncbi:MAG: hypothetical protein DRP11_00095 [Candidatus Aenigmatarchaeota archaeon]|nr:MAG: hypothetical protein DRP11_00095 [Candidatus Aenigmarchaeota archaeon]
MASGSVAKKVGILKTKPGATLVEETPRIRGSNAVQHEIIEGKYFKKLLITTDGKNIDISYSDCSLLEILGICQKLLKTLGG